MLIITCPCALGLAIPTVQTVAAGAMFRAGVLLNSGDAIERTAAIDHVVFDKTGTLTMPDLDLTNGAQIPPDMLNLAGRLALASHHPVAAAVPHWPVASCFWRLRLHVPSDIMVHTEHAVVVIFGTSVKRDRLAITERPQAIRVPSSLSQ